MDTTTTLPLYHRALDWDALYRSYPVPDVYARTVYRWSAERVRALQEERLREVLAAGWRNPFYRSLWSGAGIEPGDIRGIEDIARLPAFNSDDIKNDQQAHPPFGLLCGCADLKEQIRSMPNRLQTSGGTTGKPRYTLQSILENEVSALSAARALYLQGVRPGDVMQIPATCSLASLPWAYAKACSDYLGVLPLTTGSGVVTPARRQIEIAFDCGVNCWMSFPEYLARLAQSCREEHGRDPRELNTKLVTSFLGPDTEESLRRSLETLWGCPVYDNYGTNEVGHGAFECEAREGLHFMEDLSYFEILDTATGQPVPQGKIGNLVVTVFYRRVFPIVRFNLRDLARLKSSAPCACGSCFRRMDHFLGRSDDMVRMRGVNVYPMACLPAVRSDPRTTGEWLCEARDAVVDGRAYEELAVRVEVRSDAGPLTGLAEKIGARLKNDLGITVGVELVEQGRLDSPANLGEGKAKRFVERRAAYLKHR
ncbi:MAG: phenylacetate--CoA ligase family protein [Burkholderiales bacterium]|nr:phenylacetate--CoA ligase family protein [Burkholderiales bacterium]